MGGKTQKTTSTSKPPQYIEDAYKKLITRSEGVADTPYDPATERQVAGFTAPQTQGFQGVQSAQGIQSPYINQAAAYGEAGANPFDMNSIQSFMNPFQSSVIDSTMAQIARNNTMQQNSLKGNSVAQGGLGNSRLGVAQAELARNQDMNTQDILARLNSQNYSQALGAAQSVDAMNSSRAFQGGQFAAGLGNQAQNAAYTDINALLGIGGTQQQQQQNVNDTATANAQQQHQYPFNTTQWLAGIESGLAPGAGGTSTQTTPGPSPWGQIAGLGLTAAGLFTGNPALAGAGAKSLMAKGGMVDGGIDLDGDGKMDILLSRVSKAVKGIGDLQKAAGGRTEEKRGIGAIDMRQSSDGTWEAPGRFASGGMPWGDEEEDANPFDLFGVNSASDLDPLNEPVLTAAAAPAASGWQGLGVPREQLPAGMRNNNPGNIKYFKGLSYPGMTGPSTNTDEGDPQMVFDNPQSGMNAAAKLAFRKYAGGKRTANDLIAGQMGWTPGNFDAADNVARVMGLAPDADLELSNPERMQSFLKALTLQEHGPSSKLYGDDLFSTAAQYLGPEGSASVSAAAPAVERAGISVPQTAAEAAPASSGGGWEPNIPLLAAGLGMLASKSPNAGNAIGEGGLAGLQMLMQQRKTKSAADKLAEAAKLAQQRLGIQTESLAQRTKQQQEALTERKRHNEAVEKRGGEAAFSKNVIWGVGPDGKPALLQPGSKGEAVATKIPEGYSVAKDPIRLDLGDRWALLDPVTRMKIGEEPKNLAEAERQKATGEVEGKAAAEAKAALPNVETNARRVSELIDRLDTDPMRQSFTGYSGYLPSVSPEANDYQGLLTQVQGNTFLQAFASLKGAGAITEQEGRAATAALTRLQTIAPSDAGYQSALDDTKAVMQEILANARRRAGIDPNAATPQQVPDPLGIR